MNNKVSYSEWRSRIRVSPELKEDLRKMHNVDPDAELEKLLKELYREYINNPYEN